MVNVNIVFKSTKVNDLVRNSEKKPAIVNTRKSIYKFSCSRCNASYVGYSTRHLCFRVNEHVSQQSSSVKQHINSHSLSYIDNCFSILSKDSSKYDLLIREALLISLHKPTLNKQGDSLCHSLHLSLVSPYLNCTHSIGFSYLLSFIIVFKCRLLFVIYFLYHTLVWGCFMALKRNVTNFYFYY